jgi:hypothetical protein
MIVDAPCFAPNTVIRRDLQTLTVREETGFYNFSAYPNNLAVNLLVQPYNR